MSPPSFTVTLASIGQLLHLREADQSIGLDAVEMALPDNPFVKACVQGIIDACAAKGRDVVPRLQKFRAQQLMLVDIAGEDQALLDLARNLLAEADRRLLELEPTATLA